MDEPTSSMIEEYRAKIAEMPGAADSPTGPSIRAMLWGHREGHDRFLIELAWDPQ